MLRPGLFHNLGDHEMLFDRVAASVEMFVKSMNRKWQVLCNRDLVDTEQMTAPTVKLPVSEPRVITTLEVARENVPHQIRFFEVLLAVGAEDELHGLGAFGFFRDVIGLVIIRLQFSHFYSDPMLFYGFSVPFQVMENFVG